MMKQDEQRTASRCAGAVVLGLALAAWAGAPPGRYSFDAGTVVDSVTGLTWQNAPAGAMSQDAGRVYCQNLPPPGWRLPTVKELQSLVDIRADGGLAIDSVAFPNTPSSVFWSSSPFVFNASNAWVVNPFGYTGYSNITNNNQVRCVR